MSLNGAIKPGLPRITPLLHGVLLAQISILGLYFCLFAPGWDWVNMFRPAVHVLLAGQSPYQVAGFFNPPWTLLPLIPAALLPERWGIAAMVLAYLGVYTWVAYQLGGRSFASWAVVLSPHVLWGLTYGNIDWQVALGCVLPPQIGLFFVTAKPQIGIGVIVLWLVEAWQRNGWQEVLRVFGPVSLALLLSFGLYGWWFRNPDSVFNGGTNSSLWPTALPIGLVLLSRAFKSQQRSLALTASPFLAPYVGLQSWALAPFGLLPRQTETLVAVLGMWLVEFFRLLGGV